MKVKVKFRMFGDEVSLILDTEKADEKEKGYVAWYVYHQKRVYSIDLYRAYNGEFTMHGRVDGWLTPNRAYWFGDNVGDDSISDIELKEYTIHEEVAALQAQEQKELKKKLRECGKKTANGYEYTFDNEDMRPIIAAYNYDEPADVVIIAAKLNKWGKLTLIGDEKCDRGNEHEMHINDIFAGQLDYVTSAIVKK